VSAAGQTSTATISPGRAAAQGEDRRRTRRLGGTATVATDPSRLKLLLDNRNGLLVLVIFAIESVTGGAVFVAASGIERIATLLIFALVLLATLYKLPLTTATVPAMAEIVPGNLTQAATAEQADTLLNHTDGTFAFAQPPANWSLRIATDMEEVPGKLLGQLVPVPAELAKLCLPFKAGPVLMLSEQHICSISYLPGRSTMNGRPVLAVLDENWSATVQVFSVSKAGTTMRDITAEHLFTLLLMQKAQAGFQIKTIREKQVGGQSRTVLRGSAEMSFENVSIDGGPAQQATIAAQMQLVERGEFILVINSAVLRGVPSAADRQREIESIIASITPRRAADAEARGGEERALSDAAWAESVRAVLPDVLAGKASAIVKDAGALKPLALIRAADHLAQLAAYGHAMEDLVPPDLTHQLDRWSVALAAATNGDRRQLNELLAEPPASPLPEP